jgi:hypothetical protein
MMIAFSIPSTEFRRTDRHIQCLPLKALGIVQQNGCQILPLTYLLDIHNLLDVHGYEMNGFSYVIGGRIGGTMP